MQKFSTTPSVTDRVANAKDALIVDGRDSVQLGLEVAAGQAALATIRSFVIPTSVSLLDRVTGKAKLINKVANSAYGSLAIASTAHVLVSILAPSNTKLQTIAKLALNAAVVEATAQLPLQQWTDKLADKLLNNSAVAAIFSKEDDK